MTGLQGVQRIFQLIDGALGPGLRLGLAGLGSLLQFGARLVQLVLCLDALLLEFGEKFFGIDQRLLAGTFEVLDQAVRKLMEQVQRSCDRFLVSRHDVPPGGRWLRPY
ncbi:hypothetical protein D9M71_283870 [compost metagenome]